jgi:arginase
MSTSKPPLALIGAPFDLGASCRGAAMGPAALRVADIAGQLAALGHDVSDFGDVTEEAPLVATQALHAKMKNFGWVASVVRALDLRVSTALGVGRVPVVLGGDHSLAMGSVNAVASHCRASGRPLRVLWLDAHADFNTPDTSPSGNMHGMSVAMLCGEPGFEGLVEEGRRRPLATGEVKAFGIRSLDADERRALSDRGVDVVDMRAIDELGVVATLRPLLAEAEAAGAHIHVSFDVDSLDPDVAPGVGTPVPGGLTYREAHLVMELLHDSGLVGSVDCVELNPFNDDRGKTARLMVDLLGSLFGRRIVDPPQTRRNRA